MKKVLWAVMLLLGVSIMVSCEKENGEKADTNDIEGRWYNATKWERLLNGTAVYSSTDFLEAAYPLRYVSKVMFQNGNVNVVEINGSSTVWPYTYIEGILTISGEEFKVVKANKNELIGDSSWGAANCDEKYKVRLTTYKGVDIYYEYKQYSGRWEINGFYYYNKQGKPMSCYFECDRNPFTYEEVYDESLKAYVDRITGANVDYWYDTDRIYLKAE